MVNDVQCGVVWCVLQWQQIRQAQQPDNQKAIVVDLDSETLLQSQQQQ